MDWLIVTLAAVVLSLVAALAIPVRLDVSAEWTDRWRGHVQLRWWFATLNLTSRATYKTKVKDRSPAKAPQARPRASGQRGGSLLVVLRTRGLVPRIVRLLRDLLRQIHVRQFRLRARYGLGDPADTGQLCGALTPMLVLAATRRLDVSCVPVFDDVVIAGSLSGTIEVRPLSVLTVVISFIGSPPVWRAIGAWRRTK